jgi:hypothetical protein
MVIGAHVEPVDAQTVGAASTEFRLESIGAKQPMRAELSSPVFVVDGRPVALPSGASGLGLWSLVGLFGLVAAPVAVAVLRRRRVLRPNQEWRIETLLGQRRVAEALELSRDLVQHSPGPAARLLHARVLAHAGILLDAHDQHAWLGAQPLDSATAGENALQAASVAAKLLRNAPGADQAVWRERVVAWMQDCLRFAPGLEADLQMLPELEPFWDDVRPVQAAW